MKRNKEIVRLDSLPVSRVDCIGILKRRASHCGMKVLGVLDEIREDGKTYKTIVLQGNRMATVRYFGADLLAYDEGLRERLHTLKLMFGR